MLNISKNNIYHSPSNRNTQTYMSETNSVLITVVIVTELDLVSFIRYPHLTLCQLPYMCHELSRCTNTSVYSSQSNVINSLFE